MHETPRSMLRIVFIGALSGIAGGLLMDLTGPRGKLFVRHHLLLICLLPLALAALFLLARSYYLQYKQ